jgi:hypothetical protein
MDKRIFIHFFQEPNAEGVQNNERAADDLLGHRRQGSLICITNPRIRRGPRGFSIEVPINV